MPEVKKEDTILPTKIEPKSDLANEYRKPIPKKDYITELEKIKLAHPVPYRPTFEELYEKFVQKSEN